MRVIRRFWPAAPSRDAGEVRVAAARDVVEGKPHCADAGGREIAVFKTAGRYQAIDNLCPHLGGPLCMGNVKDGIVTCPWHGSRFRVEDGGLVGGPATAGVASYPVEERDGQLYVRLAASASAHDAAPKPATPAYAPEFDKDRPFSYEPFAKEVLEAVAFPFKLYGVLPTVTVAHDADEIDLYMGEVHVTEMDLKKLSEAMSAANAKWGTAITFCLFHTSRFPGVMMLNIRGPKAPSTLKSDIGY